MLFVYNFLQAVLLLPALPLLVIVALRRKYRERVLQRLGFGLQRRAEKIPTIPGASRIWLHCLSVGEVTSALPLLRGLRQQMPSAQLMVSVTTTTGLRLAEQRAAPWADLVIAAPLDLLPVVRWFIRVLNPDLFILVETDFWPNWLYGLRERQVPAMLVNGRISAPSFSRYRRYRQFFGPLFSSFALLAMQTEKDAAQMQALRVPVERILALGNLKYAPSAHRVPGQSNRLGKNDLKLREESEIWVCGSTHAGEEEIILASFADLAANFPNLVLLLAPRDPKRAGELARLASQKGMGSMRRTCPGDPPARILILDTLGELAACYPLARLAFVGGSMVPCGGHNPLEAVTQGVPVLFGPYMEDFQEIAHDLLACGGAIEVHAAADLSSVVRRILGQDSVHRAMRTAATVLAEQQAGVIDRHLAAVGRLLGRKTS